VLRAFLYVFFILAMQIGQSVVSYGADKGVEMGGTPAEEFIGQMIDEIPHRWDV
jgi:hypothetical protein